MRKRRTMIFALILLFYCIRPVQATDTPPPSSAGETGLCRLTVYAYRLEGTREVPLPGVCVVLYCQERTVSIRCTTNDAGIAAFPPLPVGTYTLEETSAPAHYRPLAAPLEVRLSANGPHLRGQLPMSSIGLLHRQMPWKTTLWLLLPLSLLPALVRLGVTYRQKIAVIFKNFSSLVHLS